MKKKEPAFVAQTLAWCNRQRAKKGKKPLVKLPRGYQGDASSCPCGTATGLSVFGTFAEDRTGPSGDYVSVPTNKSVVAFIDAFDNGELPQYIARRTK